MGKVLIDRSSGYFFAIYAENPVGETMDVPDFVFENPSEWMLVEGKIVPCPDYIDFVDGLKNAAMQRVENWELTERAAGIEYAGHRWLTTPLALQDIRDVLLEKDCPDMTGLSFYKTHDKGVKINAGDDEYREHLDPDRWRDRKSVV